MWGMGNARGSGMGNRSGSERRSEESVGRGHRKTGCQSARMRWTEHWRSRKGQKGGAPVSSKMTGLFLRGSLNRFIEEVGQKRSNTV